MKKTAFAIGCHPDDIEIMMSGTLFLLKKMDYELHYLNVANGSCGSLEYDAERIIRIRREEAIRAASVLGAVYHESFVNDIEVLYDLPLLRKLTALVRKISPDVMLTHYPVDYMEDHMNTCRLAVSAAFCRNMPNFTADPPIEAVLKDIALYHCMPSGLLDPLCRKVEPGIYVDVESVMDKKVEMLSEHKSQKDWLDRSQGFDSYIKTMTEWNFKIGEMSGEFKYAEGWTRHLPIGLCSQEHDPLKEAIGGR